MGVEDIRRQAPNVDRMRWLGARVIPVHSGTQTLKDAINEAMRDWVTNVRTTYYVIGSVVGPHPYPAMSGDFQSVIGTEARHQIFGAKDDCRNTRRLRGWGIHSMGLFHPFYNDRSVRNDRRRTCGTRLNGRHHAASLCKGTVGVLHGSKS